MEKRIKQDLFKVTLFVVMVLLAIPCSAKREIKQVLNIPTASNEINKIQVASSNAGCSAFLMDCVKYNTDNNQKIKNHPTAFSILQFGSNLQFVGIISETLINLEIVTSVVPIYILHERYQL